MYYTQKIKSALVILTISGLLFSACSKKSDPLPIGNDDDFVELTGNLTTRTLTADKKYLLRGQVFVRNGQVLTIQPGTVIYGQKSSKATLVIDRGGRLVAEGTVNQPIVFTSNQALGDRDRGDWGGIVMLGNASTNQVDPAVEGIDPAVFFGGNPGNTTSSNTANDAESSGILKYVRIEFAGIELSPNNETNSLTMGGVGRGTTLDYVQVSYGGDDGFEWFGGTVNAKHLISFNMWDDDFDVDYGWSGNVQFAVSIKYPSYADQSGSNIFETDNGPNDNDVQPYTTGTFSNITGIGPIKNGTSISNGNFQHALDMRRRTAVSIFNSVFAGMPRGLRFNQASVVNQYVSAQRGVLSHNIMINPAGETLAYQAGSGVAVADVKAYWEANNTNINGAQTDAQYTAIGLNPDLFYGSRLDNSYSANPDFTVTTGTIASGASFAHNKFTETNRNGFFESVNYRGAFGATDWTNTWSEFRPVNKTY